MKHVDFNKNSRVKNLSFGIFPKPLIEVEKIPEGTEDFINTLEKIKIPFKGFSSHLRKENRTIVKPLIEDIVRE
jgi:hypothetical protein